MSQTVDNYTGQHSSYFSIYLWMIYLNRETLAEILSCQLKPIDFIHPNIETNTLQEHLLLGLIDLMMSKTWVCFHLPFQLE